jgi:outer membrane protein assembly factor BamA
MSIFQALGSLLIGIFLYSFPWIVCAAEPVNQAAKVEAVRFQGNKQISDAELMELSGLSTAGPLDAAAVKNACETIVHKYNDRKYSFARCEIVSGTKPGDTAVVFKVTEGPKIEMRDLGFSGNQVVTSKTLKAIFQAYKPADDYDLRAADADIDRLVRFYHAAGFLDAWVGREVVFADDFRTAKVVFHVIEGPRTPWANMISRPGPQSLWGKAVYFVPDPHFYFSHSSETPPGTEVEVEER